MTVGLIYLRILVREVFFLLRLKSRERRKLSERVVEKNVGLGPSLVPQFQAKRENEEREKKRET